MSDMDRLAQLVVNPKDSTREELYLAVASLYRVQDSHMNALEREMANDIMRRLAKDVEMTIRVALAERLADDATAPHELILLLADDRIEVARPIILRSPMLTEADMLRLATEAAPSHREALAARPNIGEKITDALVDGGMPSVLTVLVQNATARISANGFDRLVECAKRIDALQEPLTKRADLPQDVAIRMCAFVGETLKHFIVSHFTIDPVKLESALAGAEKAMTGPPAATPTDATPKDGPRKLIEKLYIAGQLRAGFLIRVLQQGNIDLFELGLAQLLEKPLGEIRQMLYERGAGSVALICRAVGIDRCVFSTVFTLSRKARAMRPVLTAKDEAEIDAVFAKIGKTDALSQIQRKSWL